MRRKEGIRCDLPLDSQLMTYFTIKEREIEREREESKERYFEWILLSFPQITFSLSLLLYSSLLSASFFPLSFPLLALHLPSSSFPFSSSHFHLIEGSQFALSLSFPSSLSPLIPLFSSETKHRSSSFQLVTTFFPFFFAKFAANYKLSWFFIGFPFDSSWLQKTSFLFPVLEFSQREREKEKKREREGEKKKKMFEHEMHAELWLKIKVR